MMGRAVVKIIMVEVAPLVPCSVTVGVVKLAVVGPVVGRPVTEREMPLP